MYHQFKILAELDITKEPMEVGPTCHYFMGGIKVDAETTMTNVDGLFACGEAAGGMHGANRLGGNSLSDLLVFGNLSGIQATKYAKKIKSMSKIDDDDIRKIIQGATSILLRENGNNPYFIHEELQKTMQYNVGIIRTKKEIENGIKEIDLLKSKFKNVKAPGSSQFNPGWHEALALKNLLISAESVAKSALIREESRGAHTREDFPSEREEWLKYNIINKKGKDGKMETKKVKRSNPDPELKRIAYSKLDALEKEVKIDHDKLKIS